MSTKPTAEERAEERIPWDQAVTISVGLGQDGVHNTREIARASFATCIREEVEPLESEVSKLRALGDSMCEALRRAEQDLIDWKRQGIALRGESEEGIQRGIQGCIPHAQGIMYTDKVARECYSAFRAWQEHKSQGFTPTNTSEG